MERLITILRAAHCRSTHHFFAVDALPYVRTHRGRKLCNVLLKHHARYLVGAKDPDKRFRDFRNHVLHVEDGYWGGAPKLATRWYEQLIECLDQGRWDDAAYTAGVLSHYFTDPLMPLHTGQSKKESIVHRPLEWSVTKSYETILDRWQQGNHKVIFELSSGEDWLKQALMRGAEVAHRHYDQLIDDYDIQAGTRRPTEGLDVHSIDILAGLFGIAITGWSKILEKAAEETRAEIPESSLTLPTLIAGIKMPVGWVLKRIESQSEQSAVRALFEEYQQTGTVTENLPEEVKSVEQERQRDRVAEKSRPVRSSPATRSTAVQEKAPQVEQPRNPAPTVPFHSDPKRVAAPAETTESNSHSAVTDHGPSAAQPSLRLTDDLVDAPSIGPKTAKRFASIGITTVEEFLAGDPAEMASQLNTRWITTEKLVDWQDQAQLVCDVANLCGYKSQLLVGVNCRDAEQLASSETLSLHRSLKAFSKTSAGRRALRNSKLPSCDDVAMWIRDAGQCKLRKSA